MSRVCQLFGKKVKSGNNRPFSMKATKRTFRPNLFKRRVFNPETGRVERMTLSAKAIKTLKKWSREGAALVETEATKVSAAGEGKHAKKEPKLTPKQKKEAAAKKEAELLGKDEK